MNKSPLAIYGYWSNWTPWLLLVSLPVAQYLVEGGIVEVTDAAAMGLSRIFIATLPRNLLAIHLFFILVSFVKKKLARPVESLSAEGKLDVCDRTDTL